MITLKLPWPPTVNTYWRHAYVPGQGARFLISSKGRKYRQTVADLCLVAGLNGFRFTGRVGVDIHAFPPDRRARDLDNLPKSVLDALQKAGVYENDGQIDDLRIRRMELHAPKGEILVHLWWIGT